MPSVAGLSPIAVLVLGAWLAVPGLGLTLALFEGSEASLPTRLALVLPLGYTAVVLTGLPLAVVHLFTRPALIAAWLAAVLVIWTVALRRRSSRRPVRGWTKRVAAAPWAYATAVALFLSYAAGRWTFAPVTNLAPTTLRYWADGVEIADAHRIPSTTLQWGRLLPPIVSKVLLSVFHGGTSLLLGRAPLAPLGAGLFVVSVGIALVIFGLARELGLRYTAPLVVLLLVANRVVGRLDFTKDLDFALAEDWGKLLALAAVLLAARALRPKEMAPVAASPAPAVSAGREVAAAGVLLGVASGTHLVAAVVGLAFIGANAVSRMIVHRRFAPAFRTAGFIVAVAGLLGAAALLGSGGDLGFQGAAGDAAYQRIDTQLGLPDGVDPVLLLIHEAHLAQVKPVSYGPAQALHDFGAEVAGRDPEGGRRTSALALALPIAAAVAALIVLLVWGDRELRVLAVTAALFAVTLLLVGMAFSVRYHVFALATFGNRRLFAYVLLPYVLLGAGVVELVLDRLRERPEPDTGKSAPVVALGLTLVLGAALLPRAVAPHDQLVHRTDEARTLAWIGDHVPCEGRVLADRRTLAAFETLSHRAGVLEGMGPHIRPAVLARALAEMFRAQGFFADPTSGRDYLRQRGVAAIVLTMGYESMGGWRRVAEVDRDTLDAVPYLEPAFETERTAVYRVVGFRPNPALPPVSTQPGYRC